MRHELDVDEEQVQEDLAQALGVPDIWEHDHKTWTVRDLMGIFDIGNSTARRYATEAVEAGHLVEGRVRGERGHYVTAYRLAEDGSP